MTNFSAPPPLALYVHFPWCVRKCPYCDFNSHALPASPSGRSEFRPYLDALLADLEQETPAVWGRVVNSVFIGGGTPSLLDPQDVAYLLSGLRARVTLAPNAEITLEANPGTTDSGRFLGFKQAGVNRLSIGAQSFDDQHLALIGRIHDARQAINAIEAAQAAGFTSLNIDLMYGLPDQSETQALADLRQAVQLAPTHISHYQLTLEPNTLFHAQPPDLPEDDSVAGMGERCREQLEAAGYQQYETSAYASAGSRCLHNLNYWQFGDYLAIGAGAHGKLTQAALAEVRRSWKQRHPGAYMKHAGGPARIAGSSLLTPADLAFEFMLNALRLNQGFAPDLFTQRTGLPLAVIDAPLSQAVEQGLLTYDSARIAPSELGRRFLNDLTAIFLHDK